MANVVINDTNLTNIANAIREKNGTTDTYKPSEMATAILAIEAGGGGGYEPTDEDLTYTVTESTTNYFKDGKNAFIIRDFGDKMKFTTGPVTASIFGKYPYEYFNVNPKISKDSQNNISLNSLFSNAKNLKEITGTFNPEDTTKQYGLYNGFMVFMNCQKLRTINDNFINSNQVHFVSSTSTSYNKFNDIFYSCCSLREIPNFLFKILHSADGDSFKINNASSGYDGWFYNCYALNKIVNLPVIASLNNGNAITSNMFSDTFSSCSNLSKLIFETNEDGTPTVAKWNNQIIDLTNYVGYASSASNMIGYNSGLTVNGNININGTTPTFQAYKTQTINDYFATNGGCSKYGHLEAVETINSLPDTSAAGGGNTIKFYGSQGYYTNYLKGRCGQSPIVLGLIKNLTEEEIAVATAKGWTVSIT